MPEGLTSIWNYSGQKSVPSSSEKACIAHPNSVALETGEGKRSTFFSTHSKTRPKLL